MPKYTLENRGEIVGKMWVRVTIKPNWIERLFGIANQSVTFVGAADEWVAVGGVEPSFRLWFELTDFWRMNAEAASGRDHVFAE